MADRPTLNREFTVDESPLARIYRAARFEGQDQNPRWQVRGFISWTGNTPHLAVALWHEFGHYAEPVIMPRAA